VNKIVVLNKGFSILVITVENIIV